MVAPRERIKEIWSVLLGYFWMVVLNVTPLFIGGAGTGAVALHTLVTVGRMAIGARESDADEEDESSPEPVEPAALPDNVVMFPRRHGVAEPSLEVERAA